MLQYFKNELNEISNMTNEMVLQKLMSLKFININMNRIYCNKIMYLKQTNDNIDKHEWRCMSFNCDKY